MSYKVKDLGIKCYFFNDIINTTYFDPDKIKIDKESYKNIAIYYIGYFTIKDSKYIKINSVDTLYLTFNNVNGYFEEINGNKYLMLLLTKARKEKIKKYEELWSKTWDLIRSITKKSDDYEEKYMKITFNSDDELPLNKTIEFPRTITVVKVVFHENNKYYPQIVLDKCLYKLQVRMRTRKLSGTTKLSCMAKKKMFLCFTCLFINCNYIIDTC